MDAPSQAQLGTSALIYVVVIALVVWRMMRPMRVSVARIWVRPIILVAFTGLAVWGEQQMSPAPLWEVAAILFAGALLGVPLGFLRGRHSEVKATDRPGIYYVHSSPFIVFVWLGAFVARAAIRYALPGAAHGVTIWSIGLLAFATAAIFASAVIVHRKLQLAMQQAPAA